MLSTISARLHYQELAMSTLLPERRLTTLRIHGSCMKPLITDGDQVSVRKKRWYWPGDVLATHERGQLKLHRCVGYAVHPRGVRFITCTDGERHFDRPWFPAEVLGCARTNLSRAERIAPTVIDRVRAASRGLYWNFNWLVSRFR